MGAMKWLRVVELTQQSQPHLHVVIGTVRRRIRCYGAEGLRAVAFWRRMGRCDCLAHVVSGVWLRVTGDSWIVDATPVAGAGGAGGYLAKYMRKGSLNRVLIERLGFVRRWSSSRGWPGSGRMRLRQTMEGGWAKSDFSYSGFAEPMVRVMDLGFKRAEGHKLLDRVGPELVEKLGARRLARGSLGYIGRSIGNEHKNVSA